MPMKTVRPDGIVCFAGMLGTSWVLDSFDVFADMQSGDLTMFGSGIMELLI